MRKQNAKSSNTKKTKKSYDVEQKFIPTAISRRVTVNRPTVNSSNGATVISHTEFVRDVNGTVAFSAGKIGINPGSLSLFPWLSSIARQFESYRFRSLKFHYEPSVSTQTAGVIHLAVDYDSQDATPTSKNELMSNVHAVRSPPYMTSCYTVDSKDSSVLSQRRFVRTSDTYPVGTDPKTYDIGALIYASSGFAAPIVSGELYVTYTVELITPQLDFVSAAYATSARLNGSVGVSKTNVFGTTAATVAGGLAVTAINSVITFPHPGEYVIDISYIGTGCAATVFTVSSGGSVTAAWNTIDATSTGKSDTVLLKVIANNTTLTLDCSAFTTVTALTARVGAYAYANS